VEGWSASPHDRTACRLQNWHATGERALPPGLGDNHIAGLLPRRALLPRAQDSAPRPQRVHRRRAVTGMLTMNDNKALQDWTLPRVGGTPPRLAQGYPSQQRLRHRDTVAIPPQRQRLPPSSSTSHSPGTASLHCPVPFRRHTPGQVPSHGSDDLPSQPSDLSARSWTWRSTTRSPDNTDRDHEDHCPCRRWSTILHNTTPQCSIMQYCRGCAPDGISTPQSKSTIAAFWLEILPDIYCSKKIPSI
jgi:hypothetical protein